MNIKSISDIILDEASSAAELRDALNTFVLLCSDVSGIRPDASFDAWAEDSLLDNGVAINPRAAAHCAVDYQRSVMFIRGVYSAINTLKLRFPDTPIEILYAGCGPFATLLLPLLGKFNPAELCISMLDIHQRSLESVELLLAHFELGGHAVRTIRADACHYTHPRKLHLVIAETMQKSLEQEPQFAVTANLGPQLWPTGIFIPQCIEVVLCLADLAHEREEKNGERYPLATVCTLSPESVADQLDPITVVIPKLADMSRLDAALFTRIAVFEQYLLHDYESEITLPQRCHELAPLAGGERYKVSYQLGSYPKFNFECVSSQEPSGRLTPPYQTF